MGCEFCSLSICISVLLRLDTDHTGRTWFPSSWQQGCQATNHSPSSSALEADWLPSLQPVVECPSLTSLLPSTAHIHPISQYGVLLHVWASSELLVKLCVRHSWNIWMTSIVFWQRKQKPTRVLLPWCKHSMTDHLSSARTCFVFYSRSTRSIP